MQNIDKIWLQPLNYYIDDKLRVYLFYPESVSLYQLLHSEPDSPHNFHSIMKHESNRAKIRVKYEIAFQLSKILLTIHSLGGIKKHGHLSSHNIFINLRRIASKSFELRVRVSDIENFDFMDYSNKFYNYRMVSVWSAPESLQHLK